MKWTWAIAKKSKKRSITECQRRREKGIALNVQIKSQKAEKQRTGATKRIIIW